MIALYFSRIITNHLLPEPHHSIWHHPFQRRKIKLVLHRKPHRSSKFFKAMQIIVSGQVRTLSNLKTYFIPVQLFFWNSGHSRVVKHKWVTILWIKKISFALSLSECQLPFKPHNYPHFPVNALNGRPIFLESHLEFSVVTFWDCFYSTTWNSLLQLLLPL